MMFGYLDPASGGLILQAVLGGAAGVGVAAKAWRARLKGRKAADTAEDTTSEEVAVEEEQEV
ncbi:MAG: hypothetical protein GEU79_00960 [Acidimicrobiia bacterium]|nr:hypothetical protein [Acidimicrobiia bacterium]